MSVSSVVQDGDNLTLTLIVHFNEPIERVGQLWSDHRQLERWWGPPTHPATFKQHDLTPGGEVTYCMPGSDGETFRGKWRIASVKPPSSLEFADGFVDQDRNPVVDLPSTGIRVQLSEHGTGTRMVMRSVFESRERMEEMVSVGAVEVLQQAVSQMDALLAK